MQLAEKEMQTKVSFTKDRESILVIEQHKKIEQTVFIDNDLKVFTPLLLYRFPLYRANNKLIFQIRLLQPWILKNYHFPNTKEMAKGDFSFL